MSSSQYDPRPGQDDAIGGDAREDIEAYIRRKYPHTTKDHTMSLTATPEDIAALARLRKQNDNVPTPRARAPDLLSAAAETFRQRNAIYGDNYTRFGDICKLMFPNGVVLNTPADFNRYGQLFMCLCKLTRYAEQFENGGHQDSARDLCVYAAMLEEMTQ